MKKLISLFFICIFVSAALGQDMKHAKSLTNKVEDLSTQPTGNMQYIIRDNMLVPTNAIPGSVGFWDYMTNGSNLNNIQVYGDTVIVCYPWAREDNPTGSSSRTAYYLISTNAGVSWSEPLAVSTLPTLSAYPELHSYIFSGSRQVALSGRKYNPGSLGGAWKDAFFGLGSFTGANVPIAGKDFFGAYQNGSTVGGVFSTSTATEDSLWYNKYDANTNTFGSRVLIANPSLAQIGFNVRYRMVSDQTGNNLLAVWYKDSTGTSYSKLMISTSANGGTSWSTPNFIQRTRGLNSVLAPGDTCMTWFGIDAAYKPNSSEYGVAWSTLGPTADNTGGNTASNGSCKILFYSPSINGGVPTIVAGKQNMTIISDTSKFNNRQSLQVGVLPVSHPSIAYSADGTRLFCAFSAFQPGDSANSFTYNDIYYTWSDNGGLTWVTPINLTNTHTDDELYPTISTSGNTRNKFHVHYQSTITPGSQSFSDLTSIVSPVYQCYKAVDVPNAINEISSLVPDKFSLQQNYPNPFNPTTSIRFDVAKASRLTLNVYDMSGKLVQTLINNELVSTGTKEVVFDAGKLSSGVYFYTLSSDNFKETKKMMLVK